jgi:hypothetical protein
VQREGDADGEQQVVGRIQFEPGTDAASETTGTGQTSSSMGSIFGKNFSMNNMYTHI